MKPPIPHNEADRFASLQRYGILDTPPDAVFDNITQAAANICDAPIALISLIDPTRQWFKSCVGIEVKETSRDIAFCAHAINTPSEMMIVSDAIKDPRFRDNPLVTGEPNIRLYAGRPLVMPDGFALGTLCVIDRVPRQLSASQCCALNNLADAVVALFEQQQHWSITSISRVIEDSIRHGIMITDAKAGEQKILHCNRGFELMTGYTRDEVVGRNCRLLQGKDTDPTAVEQMRIAIRDQQPCTVTLKNYRKDGSSFWNEVSLSPVSNAANETTHFVAVQNNVTPQVLARKAIGDSRDLLEQRVARRSAELRQSEKRYRELFENASDMIQSVNSEGRFTFVNPAWLKTLEYHADELSTLTVFDVIHPEDRAQCRALLQRVLSGESVDDIQVRFVTKSGKTIEVVGNSSGHSTDGQPTETQAIFHNVTVRNEARRSLQLAKELAESATAVKSRFLAATNHDLRQPLHAIGLYLHALERTVKDPEGQSICGKIRDTLDVTCGLLDTLLDLSKLETGTVSPTRTNFSIQSLFASLAVDNQPLASQKGLRFNCDDIECVLYSDELLLQRILANLIGNAIRYTRQGSVDVRSVIQNQIVQIEVHDTGIGISDGDIEQIFEDYVQLDNPNRDRQKGIGLGLSIVRHLTNLLGHKLEIQSKPGKGSVFSIKVPLGAATADQRPEQQIPQTTPAPANQQVILLVDDEQTIVDATDVLMTTCGYEVYSALNAEAALKLVTNGLVPDILVTDLRLPGMNGIQLIKQARTLTGSQLPAILVTGDSASHKIVELIPDRCIVAYKPVDVISLLQEIDRSAT